MRMLPGVVRERYSAEREVPNGGRKVRRAQESKSAGLKAQPGALEV
ncbi:MAG: hypothetical protein IPN07_13310 [Dehalococcoidia bacterium]|nr:hypothetical protein [Dehalococcoidia bacterium]